MLGNPRTHQVIPVSVFLVVNTPPWFGFSYLYVVLRWATFQTPLTLGGNLIFPVTYASATLTSATAIYLFRNRTQLPTMQSLIQGSGLAFAGAALFEITYQLLGYYFYPLTITGAVWLANYVLNGSWLFLAFTSVEQWRLSMRFKITASGLVLSWTIWAAVGFPQLFQQNMGAALIANSITKILSFATILSAIDFRKNPSRERQNRVAEGQTYPKSKHSCPKFRLDRFPER